MGRRAALRGLLIDQLRLLAIAAILASAVWWSTGQRLAAAFALVAVPVLIGQAVAIAALSELRRRAALEAIAAGYEDAPVAEIARLRAQLLERGHRLGLARRLVGAATTAYGVPIFEEPSLAPVVLIPQLRTTRRLLEQVVPLLVQEPCRSARGIAMCELLLDRSAFQVASQDDVTRLEHDLQRLRFILRARL